jgi:hypothetical protein
MMFAQPGVADFRGMVSGRHARTDKPANGQGAGA